MKGSIKWYNRSRGYGFITGEDGTDYFLYFGNFTEKRRRKNPIAEGTKVSFDIEISPRGPKALNVAAVV